MCKKVFEFTEHNLYQVTYQVVAETEDEAYDIWSQNPSEYQVDSYLLGGQEEPYVEVVYKIGEESEEV